MKKTIVTLGTVATVVLSSTFTAGPVAVSAEKNMNSLKNEQKELNQNLSKVEVKIKDILLDIEKVHNEIVALQAEIDENNQALKEAEKAIKKHEKEIDELNKRIEERSEILKDRISSYQEAGGNVKFLEVILGAKSPLEFLGRVDAVTTMTGADQEIIDEQEADLEKVEAKMDELAQMKADLEGIHRKLAYDLEEEKKAKRQIAKKEKELKNEKEKIEADLGSISGEIAALEAEIRAAMDQEVAEETEAAVVQTANETSDSNNNVNSTNETTSTNNSNNNNERTNPNNSSNNNSSSGTSYASSSASSGSTGSNTSSVRSNNSSPKAKTNKASKPKAGNSSSVISTAKSKLGTKYKFGKEGPSEFDCSGFVQWVYKQHGVDLPRTASAMRQSGTKVSSLAQAQKGDLVIFGNGTHVGIYLGGGKFIGSQTSTGVDVADMTSGHWAKEFKKGGTIRRVR